MIGDAYKDSAPNYPDNLEVPSNDLMKVHLGKTSANDIEMVWMAWLKGQEGQGFFDPPSEALRLK